MVAMEWNPFVNQKLNLEGEYGLADGYTEAIKFESGKDRIHLKNSYVPLKYPVSLALDNKTPVNGRNTEFAEFKNWHDISLRYGTLPFYFPRIGYKPYEYTKTGETGIYRIREGSLNIDRVEGIAIAKFEITEISYLPEIEYILLATQSGEVLFTQKGNHIIIRGEYL